MAGSTAGEANIKIVPDASEFLKKLQADLRAKNYEYKLPVDADTKAADEAIEKTRAKAKDPIKTKLEVDLKEARDKLTALRIQEEAKKLGIKVDVDTKQADVQLQLLRAQAEAKAIKIRTETDKSSFDAVKKHFGELTDSILSASKSFAGFTAIGELPALATALASVTGVAEQLSGAFAALPGVIGGGLATFGTVKLGLNGVEDAWKALDKAQQDSGKSAKVQAKDLEAVNAALALLAPNAADAVRTAHDLAGELQKTLSKPIQQNLFAGVSDDLKALYNNDLPTLQKGLGEISTALNGDLRQALQSLGSDSSKGILDRILGNTGDAEARFQKAIDPIIHGLGTLTAGSSDVLPRLADDLGRIATRFDNFITQADKDGSLQKFINNGITGVEQLGDTFLNVGKIIGDITSAAGGGQGLLGALDDATKHLDEFLKTPEGQASLKNFFAEGKKDIGELIDVAKELPGILKGIFDGGKDAAAVFLPILKDVLAVINAIPGGAQTLADAFLLWKGASVVGAVAELAGSLGGVGSKLDALPDKANTAAGGISKAFKNLGTGAIIATGASVLGDNLLNPTNPDGSPATPSALGKLGGAATNIGGDALAGAVVAGPVGAAVGATIGAVVSIFETVTNEINTQKEKFRQQAEQDHNNPNRPGNPDAALAQNPQLQNVLQPSLKAPPISATLLPAIRAGNVKGFALAPDGKTIINTATGQPVDVSGLNLTPAPPAPPPVAPPKPVSTVGGVPFPVVPSAATPSSVTAVQSPTPVTNPITAGTTIAAKVDPAAQQSVKDLATSITSLPTGEVNIKDGSPAVLDSVKKLDTTVTQLKDHPGEVIVKANTKQAEDQLDALIRGYQSRIITMQINASGAPPPPGHAGGGPIMGSGTKGVDSVPIMAAPGEHMLTAGDVDKMGGQSGVYAFRRALHMSGGGQVGSGDIFGQGGPHLQQPNMGRLTPAFDPNHPAGGGNFNPAMIIDSSTTSVAPPYDKNRLFIGDVLKAVGGTAHGAYHKQQWPTTDGESEWGPGFAIGGAIPDYLSIATGAAPGGTAPGPAGGAPQDGLGSFFSSLLGGLGGAFGIGGGGTQGTGGTSVGKGLFGLAQAGNNPDALGQWGQQTGDWLGKFGAKTVLSFGSALWSGALGLVGLQDSILSPTNPWFQDATKGLGFFLGQDGPLGSQGAGGKAATPKQLREANDKVTTTQGNLAAAQARMNELKPNAKESARISASNSLATAQREAQQAQDDLAALQSGGASSGATAADSYAQSHALGQPYQYGGVGNTGGYDCSGIASAVYAAARGLPQGKRYFTTESDFTSLGFLPGFQPGALNVGIRRGGGGPNSHMALTLPNGVNVESGGSSNGTQYGGSAAGATSSEFPIHYYLPLGGNQGAGSVPGLYASGGGVNGSGTGDTVPAMLTPGEHVLTTSDVTALGGQSGVYALRQAIHMYAGGPVPEGVFVDPFPKIPDARQLKPRTPPPPPQRPSLPAAPVAPTAPSAPAGVAPDPTQGVPQPAYQGGFAPVAGSDGTVKSHTLPAISKGITSGFATAGAIAQTAAAIGSFGAAGLGGAGIAGAAGGGGGGGGPSISGLFQQAGKIANDVADVASAFLVGNVTPGTTPNAYGETLRTAQNVPQTAPLNQSRNYVFNGIDGRNIVDSLQIKDAQDSQAALAGYRG